MIEVVLIATGCVMAAAVLLWMYRLVNSWRNARSSLANNRWGSSLEGFGGADAFPGERSQPRYWMPSKSDASMRKPWGW